MKHSRLRPSIGRSNAYQNILWIGLSVLHTKIEIAIFSKDACIQKLKLRLLPASPGIFFYQQLVWKSSLRIFIEH